VFAHAERSRNTPEALPSGSVVTATIAAPASSAELEAGVEHRRDRCRASAGSPWAGQTGNVTPVSSSETAHRRRWIAVSRDCPLSSRTRRRLHRSPTTSRALGCRAPGECAG
jgi:hypothetical protein